MLDQLDLAVGETLFYRVDQVRPQPAKIEDFDANFAVICALLELIEALLVLQQYQAGIFLPMQMRRNLSIRAAPKPGTDGYCQEGYILPS